MLCDRRQILSPRRLLSFIVLFVFLLTAGAMNAQPSLVTQLPPSSKNFKGVNNLLFYTTGDSLWKSDGTTAGTLLVTEIGEPIVSVSNISIGNTIYLITQTGSEQSLWKSDGTASNTIKIGTQNKIVPLIAYGGALYLIASDGTTGFELWKAVGNTLTQVKDINPGSGDAFSQYGGSATISNNILYFIATSSNGTDIWKTDGTTAGTMLAVDAYEEEGFDYDNIYDLKNINGTMFFVRTYSADGWSTFSELWKTEGTDVTTNLVKVFDDYDYQSSLNLIGELNGKLYFVKNVSTQHDIWLSDGTESGTTFVKTVAYGDESQVTDFVKVANNYAFFDEGQTFPGSIWKSDGTAGGTQPIHDLADYFPYSGSFSWINITGAGNLLFFADLPPGENYGQNEDLEVYQSDLTPQNTRMLKDIFGVSFSGANNIEAVGSNVFFTTRHGADYKLWYYDPSTTSPCTGTGGILHTVWKDVSGTSVSQVPTNTIPSETDTVTVFEGPTNYADHYGSRFRGFLCVPQTGNYRFWIASNDNSELWLSTSTNPAEKVKIAYVNGGTNPRQYDKYASQQSVLINLVRGRSYYIEALHKEGVGGDHISVGMQLPDGTLERPITGARLIPFVNQAPFVEVELPYESEFAAPANITLQANAWDEDGNIVKVEFFRDGIKLGEDTTVPFTYAWNNVTEGHYSITMKAYDNDGASTMSEPKLITVYGCSASGQILREVWTNISGTSVSDIPVNSPPNATNYLTLFEGPTNIGTRYGTRIRGYICPPMDGTYIFYIASNDNGELWLSTDDNPANKQMIAYVVGGTASRQWSKYSSQISASIWLKKNKRYYIEALHKQGQGTDNIAVGWLMPNSTYERPIPGSRLSPFYETTASGRMKEQNTISINAPEVAEDVYLAPNPASNQPVKLVLSGSDTKPGANELNVEIISALGAVVYSKPFNCEEGCNEVVLDIQDRLSPGVYIVNGVINRKRFSKRLIVK